MVSARLRDAGPVGFGLLVAVALAPLAASSVRALPPPWDVSQTTRTGQWTLYNRTSNGSAIGLPLAEGDMNGDGRSDVILTPMNANSGPNRERLRSGEAAIVLSSGEIGGERDLALLRPPELPPDVTLVYGANPLDVFGTEVFAGDFDGDGFDDVVIGAEYGDGAGDARPNCGEATIVWGGKDIGGQVIDLAEPPPGAVTSLYGAESGDRFGVWVGAGDFDGDGLADVLVGADQGDGPAGDRIHAGQTYVIYGGAALRAESAVDLASPSVPVTVVYGIDREDHSGATVRGADVDRDGVGDLLIGAGLSRLSAQFDATGGFSGHASAGGDGPNNACDPIGLACDKGEAYVVYGTLGERPASIDLADPPASTTFIYGGDAHDAFGEELSEGDFDGDGFGDVLIGALVGDGPANERPDAGEAALVYGGPTLRGAVIDIAFEPPGVTRIFGAASGDITGDTALMADVDGDGLSDVVLSSPTAPVGALTKAGTVHIFFGTPDRLPARIDLAAIQDDISAVRIQAGTANDILSYSSSAGDVDGDGRADPLFNLMGGDGFDDHLDMAGDAVVLSGRELARLAGRLVCAGDCDRDDSVSVDELVLGVRIALSAAPIDSCESLDASADGSVDISELLVAIDHSIRGCDAGAARGFARKSQRASLSLRERLGEGMR